jgi:hypothetical protein
VSDYCHVTSRSCGLMCFLCSDLVTTEHYPDYYHPLLNPEPSCHSPACLPSLAPLSSREIKRTAVVSLSDIYQLVNELRLKRQEALIGEEKPSFSSTVYATETSLLNCWGLIELDRVRRSLPLSSFLSPPLTHYSSSTFRSSS